MVGYKKCLVFKHLDIFKQVCLLPAGIFGTAAIKILFWDVISIYLVPTGKSAIICEWIFQIILKRSCWTAVSWVTSKQLITVSVVASAQVVFLHFGMQPNCKKSLYNLYITILDFHKIMLTVIYITILYLLLGSIFFIKWK